MGLPGRAGFPEASNDSGLSIPGREDLFGKGKTVAYLKPILIAEKLGTAWWFEGCYLRLTRELVFGNLRALPRSLSMSLAVWLQRKQGKTLGNPGS